MWPSRSCRLTWMTGMAAARADLSANAARDRKGPGIWDR